MCVRTYISSYTLVYSRTYAHAGIALTHTPSGAHTIINEELVNPTSLKKIKKRKKIKKIKKIKKDKGEKRTMTEIDRTTPSRAR